MKLQHAEADSGVPDQVKTKIFPSHISHLILGCAGIRRTRLGHEFGSARSSEFLTEFFKVLPFRFDCFRSFQKSETQTEA